MLSRLTPTMREYPSQAAWYPPARSLYHMTFGNPVELVSADETTGGYVLISPTDGRTPPSAPTIPIIRLSPHFIFLYFFAFALHYIALTSRV